jgi:ribose 5-phosphate isomerase A
MNNKKSKNNVGKAAAELVKDGMRLGLGTGSTAAYFITHLIERCQQGLKIQAVATSQQSWDQASAGGIPMIDINKVTSLDLTVDGADEIDGHKRMIKGGGGALLREKIIASISKEMVVIIDNSKEVQHLGKCALPVEIIPFAHHATIAQLKKLGYKGTLRKATKDQPFITDNNNYIFDIHLQQPCLNPENDDLKIRNVPGVVTTGFFFNLAGRVIVGFNDGHIEIRP